MVMLFKKAQKVTNYLSQFGEKICCLSEKAQSVANLIKFYEHKLQPESRNIVDFLVSTTQES